MALHILLDHVSLEYKIKKHGYEYECWCGKRSVGGGRYRDIRKHVLEECPVIREEIETAFLLERMGELYDGK